MNKREVKFEINRIIDAINEILEDWEYRTEKLSQCINQIIDTEQLLDDCILHVDSFDAQEIIRDMIVDFFDSENDYTNMKEIFNDLIDMLGEDASEEGAKGKKAQEYLDKLNDIYFEFGTHEGNIDDLDGMENLLIGIKNDLSNYLLEM